jgi:hypothetical protein
VVFSPLFAASQLDPSPPYCISTRRPTSVQLSYLTVALQSFALCNVTRLYKPLSIYDQVTPLTIYPSQKCIYNPSSSPPSSRAAPWQWTSRSGTNSTSAPLFLSDVRPLVALHLSQALTPAPALLALMLLVPASFSAELEMSASIQVLERAAVKQPVRETESRDEIEPNVP